MADATTGGNPGPAVLYDETGAQVAVLAAAPGSDTGQRALAVRVISQLGAGSGGGSTAINDGTTTTQKAAVGTNGALSIQGVTNGVAIPIIDPDAALTGSITATDAVVAAPTGNGVLLSGTSTAASYVVLACPGGDSAWIIQLTGTFGGGTVYFEESADSTNGIDGNWINVNGRQTGVLNTVLNYGVTTAGMFRGNTSGVKYVRARIVGATTPNVAVIIRVSSGTGAIFLNASLPAGTNNIGHIDGQGVAGTPAGGVVSVQGVAGGTGLPVDTELPAAVTLADDLANPSTPVVGSALLLLDAAGTWDRARSVTIGATPGVAHVNLAGSSGLVAQVSGALTGAGISVTAAVGGSGNVTAVMTGGTYTNLPIIFEATIDGTNWFSVDACQADGTGINVAIILPSAATRAWNIIAPGYASVRVRQTAAAGAQTGNPTVTFAQGPFLFDPSPTIAPIDGQKASYSTVINNTMVANAVTASTDLFNFANPVGSGRTIRITRIFWTISLATAGALPNIQLIKRTALNTGGTVVAQTPVPLDSRNIAAVATLSLYTAVATALGAAVPGVVRHHRGSAPATVAAAGVTYPSVEWLFGSGRPAQALTLLPGQSFGMIGSAAFGTAPTISGDIEHTEE